MYRAKRNERRLFIYEAIVRGACTDRKGKRGDYEHMKL